MTSYPYDTLNVSHTTLGDELANVDARCRSIPTRSQDGNLNNCISLAECIGPETNPVILKVLRGFGGTFAAQMTWVDRTRKIGRRPRVEPVSVALAIAGIHGLMRNYKHIIPEIFAHHISMNYSHIYVGFENSKDSLVYSEYSRLLSKAVDAGIVSLHPRHSPHTQQFTLRTKGTKLPFYNAALHHARQWDDWLVVHDSDELVVDRVLPVRSIGTILGRASPPAAGDCAVLITSSPMLHATPNTHLGNSYTRRSATVDRNYMKSAANLKVAQFAGLHQPGSCGPAFTNIHRYQPTDPPILLPEETVVNHYANLYKRGRWRDPDDAGLPDEYSTNSFPFLHLPKP